jgi:hypothetical protein
VPPSVFISHAGSDIEHARSAADFLTRAEIDVRLDRSELVAGASFIQFMESALGTADYCLLLWSRAASSSPYVTEEWQNALCRAIEERRAFLTVGRLEDLQVPALLRARIWVDLFPRPDWGLLRLVDEWRSDRRASAESGRPIASTVTIEEPDGVRVYVTSDLYGFTHPARLRLDEPAGLLLDRVVTTLGLRHRIEDPGGRVGVQLNYRLRMRGRDLQRSEAPLARGARENEIFQLVVNARIVAAAKAESVKGGSAVFLGATDEGSESGTLSERHKQLLLGGSKV